MHKTLFSVIKQRVTARFFLDLLELSFNISTENGKVLVDKTLKEK